MGHDDLPALTPRQEECLFGKWQDKLDKEIAHELGIAHRRVERHLQEARERLGVTTTREAYKLVARARNWGGSDNPTGGSSDLPPPLLPVNTLPREDAFDHRDVVNDRWSRPLPWPSGNDDAADRLPWEVGRRRNDLSSAQRLLLALVTTALLAIVLAGTSSTAHELGRMLQQFGYSHRQ